MRPNFCIEKEDNFFFILLDYNLPIGAKGHTERRAYQKWQNRVARRGAKKRSNYKGGRPLPPSVQPSAEVRANFDDINMFTTTIIGKLKTNVFS